MNPKLRAVIVDDDIAVAEIHRQFVASHPAFTVVGEAHSGAEALAQIERLNPDVVLLDFYLPDFSGLEVLSRLRVERGRQLEVIAVTAARDLGSVREARANGVRHYLVKPFTASALFERLDEVARQHATMHRGQRGEPLDQRTVDEIIASTAGRYTPRPRDCRMRHCSASWSPCRPRARTCPRPNWPIGSACREWESAATSSISSGSGAPLSHRATAAPVGRKTATAAPNTRRD